MSSDKPARRLEDIVENAQAIQRYVAGMDLAAFENDQRTHDAVERCLERISQALWAIVRIDLPTLCSACEDALRRLGGEHTG